jgi:hypothetical protein
MELPLGFRHFSFALGDDAFAEFIGGIQFLVSLILRHFLKKA